MADDVLGISANLDLGNIKQSIDELIQSLESVGVSAQEISDKTTKAFEEIENSGKTTAEKTEQALQMFQQVMDEINATLSSLTGDSKLELLQKRVDVLQKSLLDAQTNYQDAVDGSHILITNANGDFVQLVQNVDDYKKVLDSVSELYQNASKELEDYIKKEEEQKKQSESITETVQEERKETESATSKYDDLKKKLEELTQARQELMGGNFNVPIPILSLMNKIGLVSDEDLQKAKDYNEQIKLLQQEIETFQNTNENGGQGGNEKVTQQSESYEQLQEKIKLATVSLNELQAAYDELSSKKKLSEEETKDFENLKTAISLTKTEIKQLNEEAQNAKTETFIGKLRQGYDKVAESLTKVKETSGETTSFIDRIEQKIKSIGDTDAWKRFSAEVGQAKEAVGSLWDKFSNFMTGDGQFQQSLSNMGKGFTDMLGPIGPMFTQATAGAKKFTAALWAMVKTPLGAALAAISLALQAIYKWFTKSAEGQRVFAGLSAYVSSLLSSLTDIAVKVGEYLFGAFTKPTGALNGFAKGLTLTLKNAVMTGVKLVTSLGKNLKGLWQIITGEFKEGWNTILEGQSDFGDALKYASQTVISAMGTVVEGVKGAVKVASDGIKTLDGTDLVTGLTNITDKAEKARNLALEQVDAQRELTEAKQKQAELDITIAENREKIYTLSGKEKDELIEQTKQLEKQKYLGWTDEEGKKHKGLLEIQQQELEAQRERNKLHTASIEGLAKERQLQTELYKTQAQMASSTRMLTRMQEANRKKMEGEEKKGVKKDVAVEKAEGKYNEVEYKNILERVKSEEELESRITEARINAMKEGFVKVQRERDRENKEELRKIDEQKNAAIEAERKRQKAEFDARQEVVKANGGKPQQWDNSMFDEQNEEVQRINELYGKLRTQTIAKQLREEINGEDELIQAHASYTDKKKAIDKEYQDTVDNIRYAILEAEKKGDDERVDSLRRTLAEAAKERNKSQAQLSLSELRESPEYIRAFEDLNNTSTETLEMLIEQFEKTKQAAAQSLNPEDLNEYTKAIQQMEDVLNARDPFKGLARSMQGLQRAQEETAQAQKVYDDVVSGQQVVKEYQLNSEGKLVEVYWTEADALNILLKKKDAEAKASNRYTKSLNEVLGEVNQLASAIKGLGETIGGTGGQILSLIGDTMTFMTSTISGIKAVAETGAQAISAVEKASVILGIISTAIQLAQKLSSLLPSQEDFYEKAAEKQKKINDLRQAVSNYRLAVIQAQQAEDNWFSTTGLQSLRDSYEQHGEVVKAYYDELFEAQERYADKASGLSKSIVPIAAGLTAIAAVAAGVFTAGAATGPLAMLGTSLASSLAGVAVSGTIATAVGAAAAGIGGALVGKIAQTAIDSISYDGGKVAAMSNLRIQTQHRSFWRGQKTEDLTQWVKDNLGADLFDDKGLINLEAAGEVLDKYGDKLVGDTKDTIERLMELREQYDEFIKEIEEYVSNMYSPLVDNMADAIWDEWLANGRDAMDSFKEYASDTFKDIGKEMVKQFLVQNIFNDYKEQLKELYAAYAASGITEEQLINAVMGATDTMMQNAERQLPTAQKLATMINNAFEERGFITDESGREDQKATYNSLEKWTYDQADELISRATAMQITGQHLYEQAVQQTQLQQVISLSVGTFREVLVGINDNIDEIIRNQDISLNHLSRIVTNTQPISDISEELVKIRKLVENQ